MKCETDFTSTQWVFAVLEIMIEFTLIKMMQIKPQPSQYLQTKWVMDILNWLGNVSHCI